LGIRPRNSKIARSSRQNPGVTRIDSNSTALPTLRSRCSTEPTALWQNLRVASVVLVTAALVGGCGEARESPPPDEKTSFWSQVGLEELDEQHVITVIVPGRKCWSASRESSSSHLGACGTFEYTIANEDVGIVRAVKQSGGRWPLTLIVEFEGEEKGRATTTKPHGAVQVEG
jgi:hypothetical protein